MFNSLDYKIHTGGLYTIELSPDFLCVLDEGRRINLTLTLLYSIRSGLEHSEKSQIKINIVPDRRSPKISNFIAENITNQSIDFFWNTDELSDSKISYGTDSTLGNLELNSTFTKNHDNGLNELNSNVIYYYNITSCDYKNNCITLGTYNFTTLKNTGIFIWFTGNNLEFNAGTYENTYYDNSVKLSAGNSSGTYISKIFEASSSAIWRNLTWTEELLYGEEIESNNGLLLLHLNEEGNNFFDYSYSQNNANCTSSSCPSSDAGILNKSLLFDGVNDFLDAGNENYNFGNVLSIEFFLKTNFSLNSSRDFGILDKGNFILFLDKKDGKLKFSIKNETEDGWVGRINSTFLYIYCIEEFNNILYFGTGTNGHIYFWNGSDYVLSYDSPASNIYALKEYNNKLYAGSDLSGIIYVYDGSTWSISYDSPASTVRSFEIFNNDLYAGTGTGGIIYKYDGSWTQSYNSPANIIFSLLVYNNKLYAGSSTGGIIYSYDGSTWSTSYDSPANTIASLAEYKGDLYAGTGTGGIIYKYNSTDWNLTYDSPANTIFSLAVYDGELYAGSSTGGIIYKYNSTDWNLIYDSPEGTIYSLNLYDRKLYAGSGARGFLYTFGNNPTISSSKSEWNNIWNHVAVVSNYSGLFMYINGVLESFLSADNRINNSILPLFIGKTYGNKIFSGNLDELAVYNRTLYENEILEHYKRGALRLNVSYRSCDDNLCSGESWSLQYENSSFVELLADSNKYFQYKFNFYTYDLNYTPVLNNASVYYEMN